jgi:hypothetical protein
MTPSLLALLLIETPLPFPLPHRSTAAQYISFFSMSRTFQVKPIECRVFVSNIDWNVPWEVGSHAHFFFSTILHPPLLQELKEIMSDAGRVVHVNLLKDDQGKSKGRAIVTYNRPEVGGAEIFD